MISFRSVTMLLIAASVVSAQLASPNSEGVAMGHLHVNAADPEAHRKFWTDVIGAQTYDKNSLSGITVPGAILLIHKAVPTGSSVGSTVDHIGFFVPNLQPYYAKVDGAGFKHFKPGSSEQMMIEGPDGLRVELTEDKAATVPLRFHHVHFNSPDPKAIQAWYFEKFGAVPGRRAQWDAGDIPGANLTYAKADSVAPTQGRSLDHIGFEIKNLEAFCKKLTDA